MPRTTAELQGEVRQLVLEVEGLMLEARGAFPAGRLLRSLEELAARLTAYRPNVVPPNELELTIGIQQVRARLEEERAFLVWTHTRPLTRLLTYQVLWLAALGLALLGWLPLRLRLGAAKELEVFLGCLAWGAIGAIFCSIVGLVRRRAEHSLLPEYESWHIMKPLVGAFTGAVVYLMLAGGIKFFVDDPATTGGILGLMTAVAERANMAYLLAALCGYQERAFFTKLEQLIKTLLGISPPAPAAPPQPVICYCCCKKGGENGEVPCPDCGPDGNC